MEDDILKDVRVEDDEVLTDLVTHAQDLGRSYEVNVREILSDSLSESIAILERMTRGEDMATLARKFSKRQAWAVRGGESGFFPVSEHPEIGFRALDSDSGRTVGPVKVPEGFGLFTVLGKRSSGNSRSPTYDSLKAQIRRGLYLEKQQTRLNRYVASAARKYQVKLFYNHLKNVEVSPTNMVTKRFIGFGGTMMAVPGLYPLWDWVRNAADVEEVLP
jgi:parvulin-like peptidyl-prolyl isomerase